MQYQRDFGNYSILKTPDTCERRKQMATKIMDCDLVVLGAGGAGLVAAVKASEDGVKRVIVLEKAKKPGGATYFANGPGVGSQGSGGMGGAWRTGWHGRNERVFQLVHKEGRLGKLHKVGAYGKI